jgi:hypothetical protein
MYIADSPALTMANTQAKACQRRAAPALSSGGGCPGHAALAISGVLTIYIDTGRSQRN